MMTLDSKRVKADGGNTNDSMTFQRVSGGPGLAGKWKTKILKTNSPETLSLTPKGADGLTISLGNEGAVCDARFDGKDYPATGTMGVRLTCVIARTASRRSIHRAKDGKDMYKKRAAASRSGRVLDRDRIGRGGTRSSSSSTKALMRAPHAGRPFCATSTLAASSAAGVSVRRTYPQIGEDQEPSVASDIVLVPLRLVNARLKERSGVPPNVPPPAPPPRRHHFQVR
jgi:hypothetical protein